MISVSDSFKKAIKDFNRNIYGYVEVDYQHDEYSLSVDKIPQLSNISLDDGSGLFSNKKVMTKYATLETNYTLLDGSFVVWNENIKSIDLSKVNDEEIPKIIEEYKPKVKEVVIPIPKRKVRKRRLFAFLDEEDD